jgi:hypothetical protein
MPAEDSKPADPKPVEAREAADRFVLFHLSDMPTDMTRTASCNPDIGSLTWLSVEGLAPTMSINPSRLKANKKMISMCIAA